MKHNKIRLNDHSYERLLERTSFKGNRRKAGEFIKKVYYGGTHLNDLPPQERFIVKQRIHNQDPLRTLSFKKAVVYEEGVYIFDKSNLCRTILKNPLKSS